METEGGVAEPDTSLAVSLAPFIATRPTPLAGFRASLQNFGSLGVLD